MTHAAIIKHLQSGKSQNFALFLDVDGTLAAVADTLDMARIPAETLMILGRLQRKLGGALGLVSGRAIASVDALCAPESFPVAGQHGMEIRLDGKTYYSPYAEEALMAEIRDLMECVHRLSPQLLVEYKGLSIAVHYRRTPELADEVKAILNDMIAPYASKLHLQEGKMVYEIRTKGVDKGKAIAYLMDMPPFHGCLPIFAGDDATDEDAFATVNEQGGISIKVGKGKTKAKFRVDSVEAFSRWLLEFEAYLDGRSQ